MSVDKENVEGNPFFFLIFKITLLYHFHQDFTKKYLFWGSVHSFNLFLGVCFDFPPFLNYTKTVKASANRGHGNAIQSRKKTGSNHKGQIVKEGRRKTGIPFSTNIFLFHFIFWIKDIANGP